MTDASILAAADASHPPRVLQILPALDGGIARAAIDTAAALIAAGGRATIAAAGGPLAGELRRLKVRHIALPADNDSLLQALGNAHRLSKAIAGQDIDIVHARSRATAWTARRLARRLHLKYVATAHQPLRGESWRARRLEAAEAQADCLIAVSDAVAAGLAAHPRAAGRRIVTIRSGVSFDRFNPATVRADRLIGLAAQWRLPDDRKIVLFPARLTHDRGQANLVAAIEALGRHDIYALLLGAEATPTALQTRLARQIQRLGLGGIVGMAPFCDDMPAAYMLSDAVVVGGSDQGFSRTLVEAQAMSRPVICDAGCGAVEGMVAGETGWAVTQGAPAELASALGRALDLTTEQRAVLAQRAQQHVRGHFTLEAMTRQTLALYDDLMAQARSGGSMPV